jgi:hypothetical protein
MQELAMMREIPGQSLEGAVRFLSELKWEIRVVESGDVLSVGAGHRLLLKTSSRDAVDAFLYGVALAYSLLPRPILD